MARKSRESVKAAEKRARVTVWQEAIDMVDAVLDRLNTNTEAYYAFDRMSEEMYRKLEKAEK